LSIGVVREDPNPDLSTAFHLAYNGAAGGFDLAGGYPTRFQCLQAELSVQEFCTTQSQTPHVTALLLAPLYTFWHQHSC
jgi:hypothetical protein